MWPQISLDAINREAARLLSKGAEKPDTAAVSGLEANLLQKGAEIAQAIASIQGQLAARKDDKKWRSSAKRALNAYELQQSNIRAHLKTCRGLLHFLTAQLKQEAKQEAKKWHRTLKAKKLELKTAQTNSELDHKKHFLENLRSIMVEKLGAETTSALFREAGTKTTPKSDQQKAPEVAASGAKPFSEFNSFQSAP